MVLEILYSNLQYAGQINSFISLTWITRGRALGEFSLVVPYTQENSALLQRGNFIMRSDRDQIYQIKKINSYRDIDGNRQILVSGLDALCLAGQRIVPERRTITQTPHGVMIRLVNENLGSSASADRRIDIVYGMEGGGGTRTNIIKAQVDYGNLLERLYDLCRTYGMVLYGSYCYDKIVFNYRYFNQLDMESPRLNFSEGMGNLAAWSFEADDTELQNFAYVTYEGEDNFFVVHTVGSDTGMNRFEVRVEAAEDDEETDIIAVMEEAGLETIAANQSKEALSAEALDGSIYSYPDDYNLGSIARVQVGDVEAIAFVSEVTETFDEQGYTVFPTFEPLLISEPLLTEDNQIILTESGIPIHI